MQYEFPSKYVFRSQAAISEISHGELWGGREGCSPCGSHSPFRKTEQETALTMTAATPLPGQNFKNRNDDTAVKFIL